MKKIIMCAGVLLGLAGCQKYLDRQPLDTPAAATYFGNEAEMNLGLTGVYASSYWVSGNVPAQVFFDLYSDIGLERAAGIASGSFDAANGTVATYWSQMFQTVSRANVMLAGMQKSKDNVAAATFNRLEAEAVILRAWAYYHLMALYGDVPYYTEPLTPDRFYTQTRTPKATIAAALVADLQRVAPALDWKPRERGRVSRGVAYGLEAKIQLLMGNHQAAADAARKVMDSGSYDLNPGFGELFKKTGQTANAGNEIMFELVLPDDQANPVSYIALGQGSRALSAQSGRFPVQALVDKFETTDGKRIDQSALYDPKNPARNRDSRLKWTVTMHGDTITGLVGGTRRRIVYNIYDANTRTYNFSTGAWAATSNADVSNAFGPVKNGMGYLWAKYTYDDAQDMFTSKTSFIYMRYAEILLTYAEAMIELNKNDATVLAALNRVRKRARQPDVTAEVAASQARLRQLVRRERTVELAGEGLRLFDIRRWQTAKLVMNAKVYGASLSATNPAPAPTFGTPGSVQDLNDVPDYTAGDALRLKREIRVFEDRHYLFPVPQSEIDRTSKGLTQNPGW